MTRPRPQARREASLPKVKLIRALQDDAIRRRREKVYDATSMAVTARLLEINPEVLTAWNFRREALAFAERAPASPEAGDETSAGHDETQPELTSATIPKSKPPALPPRLVDELELTERCLRKHPKSYAAWHHRKWCVARFANAPRAPSADDDMTRAAEREEGVGCGRGVGLFMACFSLILEAWRVKAQKQCRSRLAAPLLPRPRRARRKARK